MFATKLLSAQNVHAGGQHIAHLVKQYANCTASAQHARQSLVDVHSITQQHVAVILFNAMAIG